MKAFKDAMDKIRGEMKGRHGGPKGMLHPLVTVTIGHGDKPEGDPEPVGEQDAAAKPDPLGAFVKKGLKAH